MPTAMKVQDVPTLKTGGGALPVSVPAPDLTRDPADPTFPRILALYLTENGQLVVGTGAGNNGVVAPNAGSAFEIQSTIGLFALPKMTTTQRDAIPVTSASRGEIWNTTTNTIDIYNGTSWSQSAITIPVSIPNVASTIVERDTSSLIRVSGVNNGADAASDLTLQSGRDVLTIAARNASISAADHIGIASSAEAVAIDAATNISLTVGSLLMRVEVNKLGFFGVTAVTRPTAYTLTFATAGSKTLPAAVSQVFTGIDNTAVGTVFATVADLNTVAAQVNSNAQTLKQLITDLQGLGIVS